MSAFEHIILLLSFVYALALTHLLSCAAQLIAAGSRVRFSWIQAGWMVNALVVVVANWLSFWGMRALPSWSVATILFTLGMAIANYLQASLVCPHVPAEGVADLQEFHVRQGRRYIGAFLASAIFAFFANIVYGGSYNVAEWSAQNLVVIPFVLIAAIDMILLVRWVQIASLAAVSALWVFYFVDLQEALH